MRCEILGDIAQKNLLCLENKEIILLFHGAETMAVVKHQKILPRSNTQLYYNNGGHNNNLKTLRRFHDVDDVTVKDNQ